MRKVMNNIGGNESKLDKLLIATEFQALVSAIILFLVILLLNSFLKFESTLTKESFLFFLILSILGFFPLCGCVILGKKVFKNKKLGGYLGGIIGISSYIAVLFAFFWFMLSFSI